MFNYSFNNLSDYFFVPSVVIGLFVPRSISVCFFFSACLRLFPWHEQPDSVINVSRFILSVCSLLFHFLLCSRGDWQLCKKISYIKSPRARKWLLVQLQTVLLYWSTLADPWPLAFSARNDFSTEIKASFGLVWPAVFVGPGGTDGASEATMSNDTTEMKCDNNNDNGLMTRLIMTPLGNSLTSVWFSNRHQVGVVNVMQITADTLNNGERRLKGSEWVMAAVRDEMDKRGCRQRWTDGWTGWRMEGWRKLILEERAVTETLLMMYRWPVSLPSPHQ